MAANHLHAGLGVRASHDAPATPPASFPFVFLLSDARYEGFLVIDSLVRNTSSGGTRIAPDLALEEVQDLAHEMTLKYSLFGLARGGAKAGLRLPDGLEAGARREILLDFGRHLGPSVRAGLFYPGMDMNCGPADLQAIYAGAGIPIGPPTDTSFYTAMSAANAIQGYAEAQRGASVLTIAVEGFGSVARHMARMLPPERFRIVALSTMRGAVVRPTGFGLDELQRSGSEHGDALVEHLVGEKVPLADVLTFHADIVVPSARTRGITTDLTASLRCRALIPVANCPYAPGAAELLHERGVLCLPGYLCNAGGVVGSSLADSGVSVPAVDEFFRTGYRALVRTLVEICERRGLDPVQVVDRLATDMARRRLALIRPESLRQRVGSRFARRLPRALTAWSRLAAYQRNLATLDSDFRRLDA